MVLRSLSLTLQNRRSTPQHAEDKRSRPKASPGLVLVRAIVLIRFAWPVALPPQKWASR
jgi:hypothetical protein